MISNAPSYRTEPSVGLCLNCAAKHVQGLERLVGWSFFVFLKLLFYFVVNIFDLVYDVEAMYNLC